MEGAKGPLVGDEVGLLMYLDFEGDNQAALENKAINTRDKHRGLPLNGTYRFENAFSDFDIPSIADDDEWNWREISSRFSGDDPVGGFEHSVEIVGDKLFYIGAGQLVRPQ